MLGQHAAIGSMFLPATAPFPCCSLMGIWCMNGMHAYLASYLGSIALGSFAVAHAVCEERPDPCSWLWGAVQPLHRGAATAWASDTARHLHHDESSQFRFSCIKSPMPVYSVKISS